MVNWKDSGRPIKEWKTSELSKGFITANNSKCWNETKYFLKGITWTIFTTKELSTRVLPKGCVLSHVGGAAFSKKGYEFATLLVSSTKVFRFLLSLSLGLADTGRRVYGMGTFAITPFVDAPKGKYYLAKSAWSLKRKTDTTNLTSHAFYASALIPRRIKQSSNLV